MSVVICKLFLADGARYVGWDLLKRRLVRTTFVGAIGPCLFTLLIFLNSFIGLGLKILRHLRVLLHLIHCID
jgi:hypothetical protein